MMLTFLNMVGPWLVGAVMFGLPVWLAWWLSDGFAGWEWAESSPVSYRPGYNPYTGHYGIVAYNSDTGGPVAYL
jgi:hypothetical protein